MIYTSFFDMTLDEILPIVGSKKLIQAMYPYLLYTIYAPLF